MEDEKKSYLVTLAHDVVYEVEAYSEGDAIDLAIDEAWHAPIETQTVSIVTVDVL